jgi:hypothetical protein
MFYTFFQNNSGGHFIGPHTVIVEANDAAEANEIAEEKGGVYFDGVIRGMDCECCGDRWYRVWVLEGTQVLDMNTVSSDAVIIRK